MHVQYGCGFSAAPGWRNFDASPTLRVERLPLIGRLVKKNARRFPNSVEFGDIVRGLPIAAGSCDAVYASHVLEHLALEDLEVALANTYRMLKPGGVFRLVVPDLEALADAYLKSSAPDAAMRFMRDACIGYEQRPRTLRALLVQYLGNSRHLWMWDYKSLAGRLTEAGFADVRRCAAGDAADPMFQRTEDPARFIDSVGIECRRPTQPEARLVRSERSAFAPGE